MYYSCGVPIETTVNPSDQLQVFNTTQGQPRRASVSALADAVENIHPTPTSVIDLSSYYVMRGTVTAAVPLTATPAPFGSSVYQTSFTLPTGQTSLTADIANGRFVATRDIEAVEFTVGVSADWATGSILTLQVQLGDPLNLFTSAFQWSMGGVTGFALSGSITGPASNLNDTQGILRAGQVIRLVAALSVPGNLNVSRIAFAVRTLDGK